MSYKYNNVVIKPGLYLGNQNNLSSGDGGSFPIFSSMQLSLDGGNDLSRIDDNFFLLPGYKAILYRNTDISYITVSTIDNTTGTDIKGVYNDVYASSLTTKSNQISKVDLFYNNVKIDYSNIKTMGFKASARLCWGAKLGEHSDGSYNKYALVLESSTPRKGASDTTNNETNGLIGLNRPYLSLPWVQPIKTTNSSISFWWCSKGYENGVNDPAINYELSLYSASGAKSTILNLNDIDNDYLQIVFPSGNTGQLTFYLMNQGTAYQYDSGKNICDGLWHHIVWNINGGSWTIYTDGVAETSVSKQSYNMGAVTSYSSTIGTRNVILQDNQTNGYIADFRFYKNALSTTEINGLLNGDHTYRTTLDTSSCLFQYTFDPNAVYTNNYTTYAIGAATVPYAAELRNGADIMLPSMDLTDSLGKNIKIYPFTIGSNGFSISFWWRSDGLWARQGANSRLFYLGNGDETSNITFSLEIGSNGYPSISINAPLIWYRMEGNVTNSGSGTGLNGTLVGTTSYSSTVFKRGSQSLLSNTSSYISIPTLSLNTYTNGLTIAFWFYRSGTATETFLTFGNGAMQIYSFYNSNLPNEYNMYFVVSSNQIYYTFNSINTWNHFAITLTYSTNNTSTWKLYIDGILNSTTLNKPYPTTTYSTNSIGQITGYMDDFRIYQNVLSDSEILNVSNNTLSNTKDLTTLTDFCDDTWKHVVWTMTPESIWKLYVNNALINTYTGMAYPAVIQRSTNYIGSGYLTTDGYPCGFIGDFRMYNATLSSDNVTSLYNRTDTSDNEMNLIQHYDFVEETMNANNNILYSNAPKYALEVTNATGTIGSAGQYGFLSSGLDATGTSGLTISFWWKAKGGYAAQGASYGAIFNFGSSTTIGDNRIHFYLRSGANAYPELQVVNTGQLDTGTEITNAVLSELTDFCDGDWKNVVWTMTNSTGATSTWNLYVNNKRYGGKELTTTGRYPVDEARGNAYFGRTYHTSSYNLANGYIADFRVYKEVFTPQKITDLYNNVYTDTTNLLLHTLYPSKTDPLLVNGAKISTSKTELTNTTQTQTRESSYFKLNMDGTTVKYAEASLTADLITNEGVSFAFWFKPTGTQGTSARIFDFGNGSPSNNILIWKNGAVNHPSIYVALGAVATTSIALTNLTDFFSNQVWKHMVWTLTYSAGTTSIWNVYINGSQYGTGPVTTTGAYPNILARGNCFIGKSNWTGDGLLYGQIADFRVYNSVLNLRNVNDLYNGRYTDNTSLFLNYPIDTAGTTNPSSIAFTLNGGATISQETITVSYQTPPLKCLYLQTDPSLNYHRGSYLSLPPLVKPGTNGLSFSIWWRAGATYANQGPGARLFSFSNGKHRDAIEFCLRSGTNSYPNIGVHNGIKNGYIDVSSLTSLCDGFWKHIVWTMTYCAPTQNTSTWILYVNGSAVSTVTTTGFYPNNVSRKYAYIGQSSFIQDRYPTGDFADFRVYGAVLTQANVNSLYALSDTTDNENNLLLRQKFDSTESYLYQTCDNIKPSVLLENDPAITNTSTGQHVVLPALPGLLSTDVPDRRGISISFWWKAKGLSGTSAMLFETGLAQENDVLFLRTREGVLNTYMNAQYYLGTGIVDRNVQFSTADGDIENLENGEWHHIVWTLSFEGNSSNSYWKFYMDGYFIKTSGLIVNSYFEPNNAFTTKQVNNFIGRSNWASINGCLNGYMSDFRIYNKCLTIQDVGDLYTNTYDDNSDLFLRYSFEKKIQIDSLEYKNIKAENDPSIIILLNGGATIVDNDTTNSPTGFSSYLKLTGTTIQWAIPYLPKSFASTSQTGLSFSFWFKPTGTSTEQGRIFDFGNGQQNENVIVWKALTAHAYPSFYVTSGTTSANNFSVGLTNWTTFFSTTTPVWKHVVWTLTYSTGLTSTWNAYLDKSRYGGADLTTVGRYPTDIVRTSNLIGKSNWTADTGILFGNITGFRIYTTVLTQANVDAIYDNTFTDKSNLFFSTDFKPKYNINLTPSHSTDTTQVARLYNGATLSTDTYKFGTSSLFLSNYTTTENVVYSSGLGYGQCMQTIAPLPKLGTNGISFSFWWKSAGTQSTSSILFDFAEDTNNRITFYDVSNSSTSPRLQLTTGASAIHSYAISQTNFNDSNWHHVVWNIDKYNNTWEIFYDNVSSGTINSKMYPENVSRPYCFFGRSTVAAEDYANGYIDEFRIHSKVLTATDVSNLYTNIDTDSLKDKLILYYSFNQDASRKVMDEIYIDNNVLDTPIFNT